MGPKKEALKTKSSDKNKVVSLDEQLNTMEWKCLVVFAVEKDTKSSFIIDAFVEGSSCGFRREIKTITMLDLLRIIKSFEDNTLDYKYRFLLNFKPLFDEAVYAIRECEGKNVFLPTSLLAKLIKALIRMYKEDDVTRRELLKQPPVDPIVVMRNKPLVVPNKDKGKPKTKSEATKTVAVLPQSPCKEDTKLLKRGQEPKDINQIVDDSPLKGFQLYVILSGFYDSTLPLELLKVGVPLHSVLCIDSSYSGIERISSKIKLPGEDPEEIKINVFWKTFLKLLWDRDLIPNFKDTIFEVYTPNYLPQAKTELQNFLYTEISFLLYDMSDVKRQQKNYFRHLKVWNVNEVSDFLDPIPEYIEELNQVPCHLITVPIVLQFVLDRLCGEDEVDEVCRTENQSVREESIDDMEYSSMSSGFDSNENLSHLQIKNAPTKSAVLEPSTNWSELLQLIDDDIKKSLYQKIKELDLQYDFQEQKLLLDSSKQATLNLFNNFVDLIPKKRLFSPNIIKALSFEQNGGNAGELWKFYPRKRYWKTSNGSNSLVSMTNESHVMDYCLYTLWITKIPCSLNEPSLHNKSKTSLSSSDLNSKFQLIQNMTNEKPSFTITNYTRHILSASFSKKYSGKEFFHSPDQKIVSLPTIKLFSSSDITNVNCRTEDIVARNFSSDPMLQHNHLTDANTQESLFNDIRTFLGEDIFSNSQGFEFVEELNKPKMFRATVEAYDNYICVDHMYSQLTDSIFIVFHNRIIDDCIFHEPFNVTLRTPVPLRDFFDYNLEDDYVWLQKEEMLYQENLQNAAAQIPPNPFYSPTPNFRDFTETDFMIEASLKFQKISQEQYISNSANKKDPKKAEKNLKEKTGESKKKDNKGSKGSKSPKEPPISKVPSSVFAVQGEPYVFDAYDVDELCVQYSGFQTTFFASDNCRVHLELLERLYGDQYLGLHIKQGGHLLNIYTYVCPRPAIQHPFSFHLNIKNGIIVGFSRRFTKKYIVREVSETTVVSSKRNKVKRDFNKSESKSENIKNHFIHVPDEEFFYDLKLSLPSGLVLELVHNSVMPCYVRQYYLERPSSYSNCVKTERSRAFLSNGSILKFMLDGSVVVLSNNSSIFEASLENLTCRESTCSLNSRKESTSPTSLIITPQKESIFLNTYKVVSFDGFSSTVSNERVCVGSKFHIVRNTDVETNTCYYRRSDGTNYAQFKDGTFCVEYIDGTTISSIYYIDDSEVFCEWSEAEIGDIFENDPDYEWSNDGFVSVHIKFIMEHEDYLTVIYDSCEKGWKILLPFDTTINVKRDGCYYVQIDKETDFQISYNNLQMKRHRNGNVLCHTVIDLSVFEENSQSKPYCTTVDSTGKTFIIQSNAENYVVQDTEHNVMDHEVVEEDNESGYMPFKEVEKTLSLNSSFETEKKATLPRIVQNREFLSKNNRYFILRRDLTGFELLPTDYTKDIIRNAEPSSLVYSDLLPGTQQLRYFSVMTESKELQNSVNKWRVEKITPAVKFNPSYNDLPFRSTYGDPPSWMHPFPKKKRKVRVPKRLTSRVLIETKSTDCYQGPTLGCFAYYELEHEQNQILSVLEPGVSNLQTFFRKAADDDQPLLHELYLLSCQRKIEAVKTSNYLNKDILAHYLKMSEYYLEKEEYHKYMIRFQIVPPYFEHPAGMAFLILQDLTDDVMRQREALRVPTPKESKDTQSTILTSEIEYNLEFSEDVSLSSLNYKPGLSLNSAPYQCFIKEDSNFPHPEPRACQSEPAYKIMLKSTPKDDRSVIEESFSETDYTKRNSTCSFTSEQLHYLQRKARIPSDT